MCALSVCPSYFNWKKKSCTKDPKYLLCRTPLASLATGLLRPPLGFPGPQCHPSSVEQGHWNGMTSVLLMGTVSEDGAKRCQKAKVTPQIFLTSNNPMKHLWGQLNPMGLLMLNFVIFSLPRPQPVNSPVFAPSPLHHEGQAQV